MLIPFSAFVRATAAVVVAVTAVETAPPQAPRRTLRIGGEWSLTADTQNTERLPGGNAKIVKAEGNAVLKRGKNLLRGPWDLEIKGKTVQCDFAQQKFIVTGSPWYQQRDAAGVVVKTVTGEEGTVFELDFRKPDLKVTGPNKVTLPEAAAGEKPPVEGEKVAPVAPVEPPAEKK